MKEDGFALSMKLEIGFEDTTIMDRYNNSSYN